VTDFFPSYRFLVAILYTARDAGVIWLASKNFNDGYPVSILLVFAYSLHWLSTPISEHSRLSVPESRITDEFTNAQHLLNMTDQYQ
jgi:hypothetical protein